jgi:hypothetical protein
MAIKILRWILFIPVSLLVNLLISIVVILPYCIFRWLNLSGSGSNIFSYCIFAIEVLFIYLFPAILISNALRIIKDHLVGKIMFTALSILTPVLICYTIFVQPDPAIIAIKIKLIIIEVLSFLWAISVPYLNESVDWDRKKKWFA